MSIACSILAAAVVVFWIAEAARGVVSADFYLAATVAFFAFAAIVFARTRRHGIDGSAMGPLLIGIPALDTSKFPVGAPATFVVAIALSAAALAIEYRVQAAHARMSERKCKELQRLVRRSRRTLPWFVSIAFATGATWVAVRPPMAGAPWIVLLLVEILSVLASVFCGVHIFYFGRVVDQVAAAERELTAKAS